jgi:hypothetical protein
MLSLLSRTSLRVPGVVPRRTVVTARFPYGVSSFRAASAEGRFLVDKTAYIRTLEAGGEYIKIWRPRRFGKSLICNMLAEYYDVANNENQVIILPSRTVSFPTSTPSFVSN